MCAWCFYQTEPHQHSAQTTLGKNNWNSPALGISTQHLFDFSSRAAMPGMWPVRGFEVWVFLVSGWILCFGTASGWCTEGTQRGQQSTARSLLRVTHCVEWKIKNLVHTLPPSTSPGCSQLWPWTLQVWGSHSSQSLSSSWALVTTQPQLKMAQQDRNSPPSCATTQHSHHLRS